PPLVFERQIGAQDPEDLRRLPRVRHLLVPLPADVERARSGDRALPALRLQERVEAIVAGWGQAPRRQRREQPAERAPRSAACARQRKARGAELTGDLVQQLRLGAARQRGGERLVERDERAVLAETKGHAILLRTAR